MKSFSDFIAFSCLELAANESFQAYAFRLTEEDILFWEKFISTHPEKQSEIDEAVEILSLLSFQKNNTPSQFKEPELNRLLASISGSEHQESFFLSSEDENELAPHPSFWQRTSDNRSYGIAASLAGFLVVFGAVFFFLKDRLNDPTVTYETKYGENATFTLPDSSIVILNGNTRLSHHSDWDGNTMREVWVDGEAFFDVKTKGDSEDTRFVVHTPGMDVEVLGTKFSVFNRDDKANVVLNSGKIKLKIASSRDTSMLMMPDEAVEFFRKDNSITKKQVRAEVLTSWRNKVWVFENTPLYKIREMIEYTYGVEVIFKSNVDVNEELAGTIPSENLEVLLEVLAKSSNLHITRNKDQIIIEKKIRYPVNHKIKKQKL
jgi:transmembrane sensor